MCALLDAVIHPDRYPIGGLIYLITSQDLSLLGYPQSVIMQQLALYWLSGDVQGNMSSMGASPLLPSYVSAACPLPNLPMPKLSYPTLPGLRCAQVVLSVLITDALGSLIRIRISKGQCICMLKPARRL